LIKNTRLGILYIVSTPIGNLKDISYRSLDVLKEVDFCLAEDTRVTRKLFNHYKIENRNRLISYHKFSEKKKLNDILFKLSSGKNLALVSDAGSPLISDPGSILVKEVISLGAKIVVCPGPSAVISALSATGFDLEHFSFHGFSPSKLPGREKFIKDFQRKNETIVFFETSRKILKTLDLINKYMPNREVCICREMTKLYENYYRGNAKETKKILENNLNAIKGEIVIVLSNVRNSKNLSKYLDEEEIRVVEIISEYLPNKDAAKLAAKIFKRNKKIFYDFLSN
tara:strand:+ start:1574 stop:2425 length:852 start_codon:yes stop_codon:yes gene_type:complete